MQLKEGSKFIDIYVKHAVPFLGTCFIHYERIVIAIIKDTQPITRQLSYISSHAKRIKDANLMKEAPKVKKICEMFVHQMRSIMRKNGVLEALFSGNLKHRNIDGTFLEEEEEDDDNDGDREKGDKNKEEEEEDDDESTDEDDNVSQNGNTSSRGSDTETDEDESEEE